MASDLPYRIPREMGASGLTMSIAVAATNPLDVSLAPALLSLGGGEAGAACAKGFGALANAVYWRAGSLSALLSVARARAEEPKQHAFVCTCLPPARR